MRRVALRDHAAAVDDLQLPLHQLPDDRRRRLLHAGDGLRGELRVHEGRAAHLRVDARTPATDASDGSAATAAVASPMARSRPPAFSACAAERSTTPAWIEPVGDIWTRSAQPWVASVRRPAQNRAAADGLRTVYRALSAPGPVCVLRGRYVRRARHATDTGRASTRRERVNRRRAKGGMRMCLCGWMGWNKPSTSCARHQERVRHAHGERATQTLEQTSAAAFSEWLRTASTAQTAVRSESSNTRQSGRPRLHQCRWRRARLEAELGQLRWWCEKRCDLGCRSLHSEVPRCREIKPFAQGEVAEWSKAHAC